jgi:drug/metabolite transporter (DMT)-like permease
MTATDPLQSVANREIANEKSVKYGANKFLLLLAIVMGGAMSIVFLWAGPPTETTSELLERVGNALGFGVVVAVMTFIMFWVFYKLVVGISRYIHDRFYRTPTL